MLSYIYIIILSYIIYIIILLYILYIIILSYIIYIIIYDNIIILAVKPAFGGLHCYGVPSTAALQQRSDDCDSPTEP